MTTDLFGALFGRGEVDAGDTAWLQAMLDTEAALARAVERAGLSPAGSGDAVTAIAKAEFFDNRTLGEHAAATGNPVPALVRELTMRLPEHAAVAVHRGATSQDIIDTAAMLLAKRAIEVILADLSVSAASCAAHATNHTRTVMSGRTLLQQAVPVTFGLVAAGWLTAIDEARQNLHRIESARLAVQFGGAAGTLASLGDTGPHVAALLAEELGLSVPVLPWHTDRLRVVELAAALAGTCAALGKIARDITLLAQTEVAEVHENAGPWPRRLLSDAAQAEPRGRDHHPRLHQAGTRPAINTGRRRGTGTPARRRRLAQRVATALPPADPHRLRRLLVRRTTCQASRSTRPACAPT